MFLHRIKNFKFFEIPFQHFYHKKTIYNDIFTSLKRKKVQNPAKQELFSLVCYFFAQN